MDVASGFIDYLVVFPSKLSRFTSLVETVSLLRSECVPSKQKLRIIFLCISTFSPQNMLIYIQTSRTYREVHQAKSLIN